jgi:Flp pilus assembly protein TadD
LRKVCLLCLVACYSIAQDRATSPEAVQSALDASLRGHEVDELKLPLPSKNPPGEGVISAARLRHKVPKQAEKALKRAVKLSDSGKRLEATHEFELAIAYDPDYADAHNNLGVHYILLNRPADARRELLRAIESDPTLGIAFFNLGWMDLQSGDLTAAEQHAQRAVALSDRNSQAQQLLELVLARAQK